MQKKYQILMAKTSRETEEEWLPLWLHLKDTAGVIKKLVKQWLPEAVINAAGLEAKQFEKTAVFLAAVHDIGKATSYFQSIITKACPEKFEEIVANGFIVNKEYRAAGKTHHTYAGQWILQSDTMTFDMDESLAMIVGAHHGKPMDMGTINGEDDLIKKYPINFFGVEQEGAARKMWEDVWCDIVAQAEELAGIKSMEELPSVTLRAQVLFSGLLIIADWIASNTTYFPLIELDDYGADDLYPQRIERGWKCVAFPETWCSDLNRMEEDIFYERFGFAPNEVQSCMQQVINKCKTPGIFVLEAQMGVGKTEAALAAAEVLAHRKHEGGIFFGLPTQATSNGLFERLYEWSKQVSEETNNAICLAHNAAELNESYRQIMNNGSAYVDDDGYAQGGIEVHRWFQGNKRALLADFVIGTVDQFLMASLKRKHFMLRHVGLAGKVVIIDECHAYDAYMNEYLERSLEWMAAYGVPVILLSATLPPSRRSALVECYVKAYAKYCLGNRRPNITALQSDWKDNPGYPLLTWSDGETVDQIKIEQQIPEKKITITYIDQLSEMISVLDHRLQQGGCACIIANTVKYAQKIYAECCASMQNVKVILYHAQFTMPDRAQKEKELLQKMGKTSTSSDRDRLILIGTQVLEQSLDYDADIMVTQLCPIDLLLQRVGRLHRHKRDGKSDRAPRPQSLQRPECIILRDNTICDDDNGLQENHVNYGKGSKLQENHVNYGKGSKLQENNVNYDQGSRAVYGDYLLLRTEKVLGNKINIPEDISNLVQQVYNQEDDLGLKGVEYDKALSDYARMLREKEAKADNYRLQRPMKSGFQGILENQEQSSEKVAEASVRDGVSSIEVLLMKKNREGDILFVTQNLDQFPVLSAIRVPDSREGCMVARQRLRLPHVFSSYWNREKTIRELEDRNRKELSQWQQSSWLHGELILLLNQENQTELNGYELTYSFERGLEYIKREGEDAGEGF